jgi:hypothetical protein
MALLALLAILVGFSATTVTPETTTHPADRATLRIVRIQPLAVSGRAFKAGERVRVSANGRHRTVIAGSRGGFKVVFPAANACNGVVVVARGSEGSRASVVFANVSNVHCLAP